jgi:hypothetical protein
MNERYTPYDPKLAKSITESGQDILRKLIEQLDIERTNQKVVDFLSK